MRRVLSEDATWRGQLICELDRDNLLAAFEELSLLYRHMLRIAPAELLQEHAKFQKDLESEVAYFPADR